VNGVVFSPDGKSIATASYDGTARLWTLTGRELMVFRGHQGQVSGVSFNPNGRSIATVGYDGTTRLWLLTGQELVQFSSVTGEPVALARVSFSPDGQQLASVGENGTVELRQIKSLSLNQLLAQGCEWLKNYLANNSTVRDADAELCNQVPH
jgi:WD40 repeat protein